MSSTQGNTAPSLLQDLLQFDPRLAQDDSLLPRCRHDYTTNYSASNLPELDQRPGQDTRWAISCICQNCRCHLDVSINFRDSLAPCPNPEFPLHHFILRIHSETVSGEFTFLCSASQCQASLTTQLRQPLLSPKDVLLLTDLGALETRFETAVITHPDLQEQKPIHGLKTLKSYVRDASQNSGDKKVPAQNKRFMLSLGAGADDLLTRLGFRYSPPEKGSDAAYWVMPRPLDEAGVVVDRDVKRILENTLDELAILIKQRPEAERRGAGESGQRGPPATRDLERVLGMLDYDRALGPRNNQPLATSLSRAYQKLGVLPDFADRLVIFAYDQQVKMDPVDAARYFQALKEVASERRSELLETKAVLLESQGQMSAKDIDDAYRHLGFDPAHATVLTNDHIISSYQSRLRDVGQAEQARLRESLKIVGDARHSEVIKQCLSSSIETYAQALAWLNAQEDTTDDFISTLVAVRVSENESDAPLARKAVQIIQQARNSAGLRAYLDSGELPVALDVPSAYRLLGIEPSAANIDFLSDDSIYNQYAVAASDDNARRAEYRNALSIIAEARDSTALMTAIREETAMANMQPEMLPLSEPRGLRNIGNTCYLSSLLQYFYTVKPIHRVLDNFEQQKEESQAVKKVGGTLIKHRQVEKAQDFALELGKLFQSLSDEHADVVVPERAFARLAYADPALEQLQSEEPSAVVGENAQLNPTGLPDMIPPPVHTEGQVDEAMSDVTNVGTNESRAPTKDSEPQPMADQGSQAIIRDEETVEASHVERVANVNTPVESVESSPLPQTSAPMEVMLAPPVPPRPTESSKKRSFELFAEQNDVTEAISKVMDQLRWAIKPLEHTEDGEQVDTISQTFYGKENYVIVDDKGEETTRSQPFYNLGVFVESEPRNMYAALDEALGLSEIEGPPKRFEYRTISDMPQILQLSIQRIRWNGSSQEKIQHQLPLEERIYLDRYMADEGMLKKRRIAWDLEARHRQLKARRNVLTSKDLKMDYGSVLEKTGEYLSSIDEYTQEPGADGASQDLLANLQAMTEEVRAEVTDVDRQLEDLEGKLSTVFEEPGRIAYRLHAVFIHVGSNPNSGHWYVYIHDPTTDVWRQYNDEKVTIVADKDLILHPSASRNHNATSAVVIYVREAVQKDLIQTVCRTPAQAQTAAPSDTTFT